MTHFGVVAPAFYSHFSALQVLAGELIARGHRVTFFQQADARQWIDDMRIHYRTLGAISHPPGSMASVIRRAARPGPLGIHKVIADMAAASDMLCHELPAALQETGVEALICDQMEGAGGLVARALAIPYVSVACALPIDRADNCPLPVMPFDYASTPRAWLMYHYSARVYDWFMRPHARVLRRHAQAMSVPFSGHLHDALSPRAQISQSLSAFEFPRDASSSNLYHVGPLRSADDHKPDGMPDDIDPSRPFVFVSLGTLQGGRLGLLRRIVKGCRLAGAQTLVAHCGGLDERQEATLRAAGAGWVTDFAPQRAVLDRADMVVTHGGLNTVMDAIAARTPMLVVPLAFDQPGVAARVRHAGIGVTVHPYFFTATTVAAKLRGLLGNQEVAARLDTLARALTQAGGRARAADVIEATLNIGVPAHLMKAVA